MPPSTSTHLLHAADLKSLAEQNQLQADTDLPFLPSPVENSGQPWALTLPQQAASITGKRHLYFKYKELKNSFIQELHKYHWRSGSGRRTSGCCESVPMFWPSIFPRITTLLHCCIFQTDSWGATAASKHCCSWHSAPAHGGEGHELCPFHLAALSDTSKGSPEHPCSLPGGEGSPQRGNVPAALS